MKKIESYSEMAQRADPDAVVFLADVLLRIYEADRTDNCGAVNGEAVLCQSFRNQAAHALIRAGVLGRDGMATVEGGAK